MNGKQLLRGVVTATLKHKQNCQQKRSITAINSQVSTLQSFAVQKTLFKYETSRNRHIENIPLYSNTMQ